MEIAIIILEWIAGIITVGVAGLFIITGFPKGRPVEPGKIVIGLIIIVLVSFNLTAISFAFLQGIDDVGLVGRVIEAFLAVLVIMALIPKKWEKGSYRTFFLVVIILLLAPCLLKFF